MLKSILVNSPETQKEFLEFPARLFRNEKNYIRPLDKDIEDVFNSNKNKFFRNGTCERFLFKNEILIVSIQMLFTIAMVLLIYFKFLKNKK